MENKDAPLRVNRTNLEYNSFHDSFEMMVNGTYYFIDKDSLEVLLGQYIRLSERANG